MPRIALAFALAALPLAAAAQPLDGNPAAGRRIATEQCSSCHQVISGLPSRPGAPASFSAIANLPSTTALSLNVFLRSSHADMPNLILPKSDADDVIAYILSLKQR